jgi:hypothetical protein
LLARCEAVRDEQYNYAKQLLGDMKYWFARVYYLVTRHELLRIREGAYQYPHMKLYEILYFHETYRVNLERWLAGDRAHVEPNWARAFAAAEAMNGGSFWRPRSWEIANALVPAMEAHIRFDLPRAIAHAYQRYYAGLPGAALADFRPDFDAMMAVFERAQAYMNSEIQRETYRIDPGHWESLRSFGMPFVFHVPLERGMCWEKAASIAEDPTRSLEDVERQLKARLRVAHPNLEPFRVDGVEIDRYPWLNQPEPLTRPLPGARADQPQPAGGAHAASHRFHLVRVEGGYDRTLSHADSTAQPDGHGQLQFRGVVPNGTYTLTHMPGGGAALPIFTAVSFSALASPGTAACTMSRPFRLAEWRFFWFPAGPAGPTDPLPDPCPDGRPEESVAALADRWVYVFRRAAAGATVAQLECRVDAAGDLACVDLAAARGRRPEPGAPAGRTLMLPISMAGKPQLYAFFAARLRLPLAAIEQLKAEVGRLLPTVDLSRPEAFYFPLAHPEDMVLRMVDPLAVAENLNAVYQAARDRLVNYVTPNASQSEQERAAVILRQKKILLSTVLKNLLDTDSQNALHLRERFAPGMVEEMQEFLQHDEDEKKTLEAAVEHAGIALCQWLESRWIETAHQLYRLQPQRDLTAFFRGYARAVARLKECRAGRAFLAGMLRNKAHWVRTNVLPEKEELVTDEVYQVFRKNAIALLALWEELVPVALEVYGKEYINDCVGALYFLSREEFLVVDPLTKQVLLRIGGRPVEQTVELYTVRVREKAFARWLKGLHESAGLNKVLRNFAQGIELVNLALALKSFFTAEGMAADLKAVIGVIGAAADTITAFQLVLNLTKKSAARVAMVSAIIDMVLGGWDALEMARRNDYKAMAGYATVAAGSALTAVGLALTMTGGGTATTVVGLPVAGALTLAGIILVGGGWIVAAYKDSDLQVFVRHCLWGDSYGAGSDDPKWAGGHLHEWRTNLDRQLAALFNLLAAYTITSEDARQVAIHTSLVLPSSRLSIQFETLFNLNRRHQAAVLIDCGKETAVHSDEPVNRVVFEVKRSEDHRVTYSVGIGWPAGPQYQDYMDQVSCTCEVSLDLFGDGQHKVPGSGQGVRHLVHDKYAGISSKGETSSKNF